MLLFNHNSYVPFPPCVTKSCQAIPIFSQLFIHLKYSIFPYSEKVSVSHSVVYDSLQHYGL